MNETIGWIAMCAAALSIGGAALADDAIDGCRDACYAAEDACIDGCENESDVGACQEQCIGRTESCYDDCGE